MVIDPLDHQANMVQAGTRTESKDGRLDLWRLGLSAQADASGGLSLSRVASARRTASGNGYGSPVCQEKHSLPSVIFSWRKPQSRKKAKQGPLRAVGR
jgi:hypothetical protein